jgi:hypothetical protein
VSGTTEVEIPETNHIETGPDGETSAPERHREPTAREQMMRDIVERRNAVMTAELSQGETYHNEAKAARLVYPDEDEPEPELTPAPTPQPAAQPTPAPVAQQQADVLPPRGQPPSHAPAPSGAIVQPSPHPQLRVVNLGGQQYQVTDDQFHQLAQLGVAASFALSQPPEPPPAPRVEPPPPRPLVDRDRAAEVVQQIQFGDKDAAVPALAAFIEDVVSRAPQPPAPQQIDVNQLRQQATAEAVRQIGFQNEVALVRGEFPDIFANPMLARRAAVEVDTIRFRDQRLGLQRPDLDVYREAGFTVRDLLGQPRPGSDVPATPPAPQAAPDVTPRTETIERKRAAPRNPQVVDRRAAAPEAPRTRSGSEIVEQMRKSRGQLSYS